MAIWFHDAARRSDAFYDRSQYIPQAWAEREEEDKRQTQYLKLMRKECQATQVPSKRVKGYDIQHTIGK